MSRDDNRQLAEGTLAVLDNQISQTTGTMRLKGTFPNQDHALWPGEFLNIRLLARTDQNVVTVPSGRFSAGQTVITRTSSNPTVQSMQDP